MIIGKTPFPESIFSYIICHNRVNCNTIPNNPKVAISDELG